MREVTPAEYVMERIADNNDDIAAGGFSSMHTRLKSNTDVREDG